MKNETALAGQTLSSFAQRKEIQRQAVEAVWLAEMDAMTERDEGLCYFIGSADGHIKIGYSKDIWRRFSEIRNGVPFEIEMLATVRGGRYREGYYHQKFAASRAFGEWFTRTPEIEVEIARLTQLEKVA